MSRAWNTMRAVLRTRDLRRALGGYTGFNIAEQAVWIAMLVYAFDRGGAAEAGVVSIVQLLPAAAAAPFLGTLADRSAPTKVQTAGYAAQAVALAAVAGVLLADGPSLAVYALAMVATTLFTISRPAQAVLTPALARTPRDLGAAMVATGWIDNGSVLVAPALAGAILAVADVGTVFAVAAAISVVGALLVAPLRATDPDPRRRAVDDLGTSGVAQVTEGFHALREHPEARLMVGFLGLEHIAWGAVDVLAVVLALDVLDLGNSGAGYLEAAFGAGGVLGAAAAVLLVGGRRLAPAVLGGTVVWGAALVVLGVAPSTAAAFMLFAVAGASRAVLDVGARTLLLRVTNPRVLSRFFGFAEGLAMLGLAVGAVLVPILIEVGGPEAALVGVGILVALLALGQARQVLTVDAAATVPVVEVAMLRRLPLFALTPSPDLDGLALALEPREAPEGTVFVEQGDRGDLYFAISSGEVEVLKDGELVSTLGRGEGFGEIALLHDVPRTATVRARTDVTLYTLDRERFVIALTGHEPTGSMARAIASERTDGQLDT
jgi:MFS family permease